jgi:mRNA-degrading endonuclease toxin of MazEF toxin-antitoxin module
LSGPRAGWLYENNVDGATAEHLLVVSENDWNDTMRDSVVVPVMRLTGVRPNALRVALDPEPDLYAQCTLVQSIAHEDIGAPLRVCPEEAWVRTRLGVRRFLDIDRRRTNSAKPPLAAGPTHWWPRQDDVHFATLPGVPQDKLMAAVSDNDWNSTVGARHCAAVRLTSRGPKAKRVRWEVPVSGGFVIVGDLYALPFTAMHRQAPPAKYPQRLSSDESSRIALRQQITLSLR